MTGFNYLGEPALVDRLHAIRVPAALRAPLLALVSVAFIVLAWWGIELRNLSAAVNEERVASTRLEASRIDLARTKVLRIDLQAMLALDRQLRAIRLSGSQLGVRLADIANRIPQRAWLTSIAPVQGGMDINGRAEGMAALGDTIAALVSSTTVTNPTLIRASSDDRADIQLPTIAFELRVDD